GPLGFLNAALRGELPWVAGWTVVTNDLIWWAPFAAILWGVYRSAAQRSRGSIPAWHMPAAWGNVWSKRSKLGGDPTMAVTARHRLKSRVADKEMRRRFAEEQDRRTGFVPDPTATAERAQEMTLADGIRPEECSASRDIIRMREE